MKLQSLKLPKQRRSSDRTDSSSSRRCSFSTSTLVRSSALLEGDQLLILEFCHRTLARRLDGSGTFLSCVRLRPHDGGRVREHTQVYGAILCERLSIAVVLGKPRWQPVKPSISVGLDRSQTNSELDIIRTSYICLLFSLLSSSSFPSLVLLLFSLPSPFLFPLLILLPSSLFLCTFCSSYSLI